MNGLPKHKVSIHKKIKEDAYKYCHNDTASKEGYVKVFFEEIDTCSICKNAKTTDDHKSKCLFSDPPHFIEKCPVSA